MGAELWTERHAPKEFSALVGNDAALKALEEYVRNFSVKAKGEKKPRAALVFGPTGVGKTLSVFLLAGKLGLEVVETNASELRNRKSIEEILGSAVKQKSLFASFGGKIILVDEVDAIAGREDRGGVAAVLELIEESSFPIILVANEVYWNEREGGAMKDGNVDLKSKWGPHFVRSSGKPWELFSFLKKVCEQEKITKDDKVLWAIAYKNLDDVRAALSALKQADSEGAWWEWNPKLLPLRYHVKLIRFRKPSMKEVSGFISRIAHAEGVVNIPESVILGIAARCDGDLRAAVNDLQALCDGSTEVKESEADVIGTRSDRILLSDALTRIFRTTSVEVARSSISQSANIDSRDLMRWLDENIGRGYTESSDRAAAYDALSRADVFSGRISRRMNYKLLKYQFDLASAGVALAKKSKETVGVLEFREPIELRISPRLRAEGKQRAKIAKALSKRVHTSLVLGSRVANNTVFEEYLYVLSILLKHNPKLAEGMGLEEDDVNYVLGQVEPN